MARFPAFVFLLALFLGIIHGEVNKDQKQDNRQYYYLQVIAQKQALGVTNNIDSLFGNPFVTQNLFLLTTSTVGASIHGSGNGQSVALVKNPKLRAWFDKENSKQMFTEVTKNHEVRDFAMELQFPDQNLKPTELMEFVLVD
jgi:hypothetical protein